MIEPIRFNEVVKACFKFLTAEYNFKLVTEATQGVVFYDIRYEDETRIISVSYENMEDYLLVMVFLLKNGKLPDYDDKSKTLHLNALTKAALPTVSKEAFMLNKGYFSQIKVKGAIEKKILKSAEELRLCLRHLDS